MTEMPPTIENLAVQIDALKLRCGRVLTNMYQSNAELADILTRKHCHLYTSPKAIVLSIPYFQRYHDLFYFAASSEALGDAARVLQRICPDDDTLRVSVTGRDEDTNDTVASLEEAGFVRVVRLARMALKKPKPQVIAAMRELVAAHGEESRFQPRFAREKDAGDIFALLAEEFDFCSDSLPEPDEILQHIKDRQVVVISDAGRVVCTHYFDVKNNIYYGRFDVTAKAYRDKFLFLRITLFMHDKAEQQGRPPYRRAYGWRNITARALLRFAELNNQIRDSIYINNMAWASHGVEIRHVPK